MLAFVAGVVGTGLGGGIPAAICGKRKTTVGWMTAFAAGVMVGLSLLDLLPEAIGAVLTPWIPVLGCLLGALAVFLLDLRGGKSGKTGNLVSAGMVTAAAIAVHNVPEGMILGATLAAGQPENAWTLGVLIGLHNIPEGMAISAPLLAGGKKRLTSAALAAASGLPTVAGALLGCFLGSLGDVWVSVLLAFAAGAMVFVSAYELYPNATEICGKALAAFAALAGIAVTVLIL